MSRTIRFPLLKSVPAVGQREPSLIITLASAVNMLDVGGLPYVDIRAWKTIQRRTESPYSCAVIEFTGSAGNIIVGDGTAAEQIGLYGAIENADGTISQFLIGSLGISLGGVMPQIPIVTGSDGVVGFAQQISQVAVYDFLSVGGILGDVPVTGEGEDTITIRARPIRAREYLG